MITTATEMYNAFLFEIRNTNTSQVIPTLFNQIINLAMFSFVRNELGAEEVVQRHIDLLQTLRVRTDGQTSYGATILYPCVPFSGSDYIFRHLLDPTQLVDNDQGTTQLYPRYFRLAGAQVKLTYDGTYCELTGTSDWIEAKYMKSGMETAIKKNPFRRPSYRKPYMKILNDKIYLDTNEQAPVAKLMLDYYRWPDEIVYDAQNPVNCELVPEAQEAIVQEAARLFIENRSNPRFESFIQEKYLREKSVK